MTTVNIYLTFNGNCEDAFIFYKSVFGGEFDYFSRFKDMPPSKEFELSDADKDKVLHVSLPLSNETSLMGCDTGSFSKTATFGNNISISLDVKSRDEADILFNALSAGGKIVMPMDNTFWGAYYGMFTDKFGINWMINCETEQA